MTRYEGLGRTHRYRSKRLKRGLIHAGLIGAAISFCALIVVLAIMGFIQSER